MGMLNDADGEYVSFMHYRKEEWRGSRAGARVLEEDFSSALLLPMGGGALGVILTPASE